MLDGAISTPPVVDNLIQMTGRSAMSAPIALPEDESLVLKEAQALIVQKSVGTSCKKANCEERSGHGQELKICSRLRGAGLARSIPSQATIIGWYRLASPCSWSPGASSLSQGNLPGCRVDRWMGCDVSASGSGKVS